MTMLPKDFQHNLSQQQDLEFLPRSPRLYRALDFHGTQSLESAAPRYLGHHAMVGTTSGWQPP